MSKLDKLSSDQLREALNETDDAKAAKRLMMALAYKDGVPVETLSNRYGTPQSTIYYWLDRFNEMSIEDAITDEARPGRPPKVSADQRSMIKEWIRAEPGEYGINADEWTPELLRARIRREFSVDYSLEHVRRLFKEYLIC